MTASTSSTPTLALPDGSLQVEFAWREDRFAHAFILPDGMRVASVEGDPSDVWPPSPPLQQLSLEQVNETDVILGVGAAGSGHWSVSVEIAPMSSGGHAFKFDFACQCKADIGNLGSCYQRSARLTLQPQSNAIQSETATVTSIRPQSTAAAQTARWTYLVAANG